MLLLEDVARMSMSRGLPQNSSLRALLIGRSLWASEQMFDALEGSASHEFHQTALANASVVLKGSSDENEEMISVKLIAVRSLKKYLRRTPSST